MGRRNRKLFKYYKKRTQLEEYRKTLIQGLIFRRNFDTNNKKKFYRSFYLILRTFQIYIFQYHRDDTLNIDKRITYLSAFFFFFRYYQTIL